MGSSASQPLYCPACDRPFAEGTAQCPNDGTRLVRIAEDPLVGREIDGRFELRERVGVGGMGAVYRGWQRSVGREVAVKVIRSHVNAEAAEIKRFMREAQLTSRLVHPNIVSVIDFGQTSDGLLYLAMELLPGQPLNRAVSQIPGKRLASDRVIDIGVQLCDALQVAHEAHIIHRDLKPSNIMVLDGPGDRVKVLDFGLARPLQGDHSTLTGSDLMLGTPQYMSPEMVHDEPLDARSDLYSLGVVLYQLLSGKVPFGGDTRAVLVSKLNQEAPTLPPEVPRALGNVILRLLSRKPEHRYASAAVTREALLAARAWTQQQPPPEPESLPSVQISTSDLSPRAIKRDRRVWLAAPALLLLFGGGWAVLSARARPAETKPVSAEVKPVSPETKPVPAEAVAAEPKAAVPSPAPLPAVAAPPAVTAPPPVAAPTRSKVRVSRKKSKPAEDYILPQ
jgi:serine/threonine protein kinase